ncbi:MAG: DUF7009 family protein [Janthinobacterium lividum]
MKIRWNHDSIRLRITPSEFQAITAGQTVHENIAFPGMQFWNITLRASDAETMIASDQHGVYLSLSQFDRARLSEPDVEGVYFQLNEPTVLRYYVEKDFPCVHARAPEAREKTSETFAPPAGFEDRKLASTDSDD